MMRIALFASLLVPVADATRDSGPPPSVAETVPRQSDGRLPLDAMRHHQPTAVDVQQRERQFEGERAARRRQDEDPREIDEIYRDVMRRSAPGREPDSGVSPAPDSGARAH